MTLPNPFGLCYEDFPFVCRQNLFSRMPIILKKDYFFRKGIDKIAGGQRIMIRSRSIRYTAKSSGTESFAILPSDIYLCGLKNGQCGKNVKEAAMKLKNITKN